MEIGSAVNAWVPRSIFTPLLLIGVIDLRRLPKPSVSRKKAAGSAHNYVRA